MGIANSSGRTSRLKRFLSMPRYDGASRSRMKRGKNADDSAIELVRPGSARVEGACSIINDLMNLWFRSFRDKSSRDVNCPRDAQESASGFRGIFSETLTKKM